MTKTADEILKRLLDSYPCGVCIKHKKYSSELKKAYNDLGGYVSSYSKEILLRMNTKFIEHVEQVHLPSKEEWEILNKK